MSTLATMKARIASELRRSDLTSQIASAISDAIASYQKRRFAFSERRDATFTTVADQEFYTAADDADLGLIKKIDNVHIYFGDHPYELDAEDQKRMEWLSQNGTEKGEPLYYCWYGRQFRLNPIPDAAYTVRIAGHFKVPAPAADDEADNAWMTEGERLIRSRAKYEIALHVLRDEKLAASMASAVSEAEDQLIVEANREMQTGDWRVAPDFC